MSFVVMGHGPGAPLLHRKTGLGAVERLDLALLINREHDGVGGRIDIEADDVLEFLGKFRVLRQLERPDTVGRELVGLQDALHRTQAHARGLRQHPTRPVGRFSRRRPQRQIHDPLHGIGRKRRLTGFARLVTHKPVDTLRHEPRLPAPDNRLSLARAAHDLGGAASIGGRKDDFGAPHMLLRGAAIRDDSLKPAPICSRDVDDYSCSHSESLNCLGRFGNRPNESDH